MTQSKPKLLYVSDLNYPAKDRIYCLEDVAVTTYLREHVDLVICHPKNTEPFEDTVDGIVVRNSGPVIYYREAYQAFRQRVQAKGIPVYNPLCGKGDMTGKQYLVDLSHQGFPTIPTIDRLEDCHKIPDSETYVVKLKDGADSIGMEFVSPAQLDVLTWENILVQPQVDFQYEISFFFINNTFHHAIYAPNKTKRWELVEYTPVASDIAFAQQFIDWNQMPYGIQRVDACKTQTGELLLVELEDLNPYLSLLDVKEATRQSFLQHFCQSVHQWMALAVKRDTMLV